jgi:predicted nucleic acid-binding protein
VATESYTAPYVDSSVFIAWINKEVVDGVDRFPIADSVIKNAERGEYVIYISALTLSEVHKLPRGSTPPLTKEQDEMIIRFFQNDCFKVLPVDRDIGETANRFCRDYKIHGNDATHLACALRAKCDVLLVWDRPLATRVQRTDTDREPPDSRAGVSQHESGDVGGMIKKPEMIEGPEAFQRFRDATKAALAVPHSRGSEADRGAPR